MARFVSPYLAPPVRLWLPDGATKMPPLRGFRFLSAYVFGAWVRFPIVVGYSVFDIRCFCDGETRCETPTSRWNGRQHPLDNASFMRQKGEKVELVVPVARFVSGYLAPPFAHGRRYQNAASRAFAFRVIFRRWVRFRSLFKIGCSIFGVFVTKTTYQKFKINCGTQQI